MNECGGIVLRKWKYSEKTCPIATLPTENFMRIGLGWNPDLRGERPASNRLSHGTYLLTYLLTYSMVQSPTWEANWFAASQEIPRILWNPKVRPNYISSLSIDPSLTVPKAK